MINFPTNLNKQQFLDKYWQKMPLLFNDALENTQTLISKERLLELSLNEDIESRLILENAPDRAWQVIHGPQNQEQLQTLSNDTHWTLLVQSVNLWHKACAKLLNEFKFIPEWRLDDIMISYASESGSVGAHIDNYDVFLIQLTGTRKWSVGVPNSVVTPLRTAPNDNQIEPFDSIIDEVLQPGDMLYVPPNTAHHGVSIEPGMTLSVGFRSPALSEMMMIFAEQLMCNKEDTYLSDPDFDCHTSTTEIPAATMTKAVNWLSDLDSHQQLMRKSFGMLQTQPKQALLLDPLECEIADIPKHENVQLIRDPAARVAWFQFSEETVWLFINGECFEHSSNDKDIINQLSQMQSITSAELVSYHPEDKYIILLQTFVDSGLFGLQ